MKAILTARSVLYPFALVSLVSCSSPTVRPGDRKLASDEVPEFLRKAGMGIEEVEYFEKRLPDGTRTFEAKNPGVSIKFDARGGLIEREEDISFRELPAAVRKKISAHLSQHYPEARVIETERRATSQEKLLDVEIRHDSSPSGYWELSFSEDGSYLSREVEDYDPVMTLN